MSENFKTHENFQSKWNEQDLSSITLRGLTSKAAKFLYKKQRKTNADVAV